jgi:glycerol kinase
MDKLIMALDQGTSSSRSILFDSRGEIIAAESLAYESVYPRSGWVEQDPDQLWLTQRQTMQAVLDKSGKSMKDITAIGITNQRETIIGWDRLSGRPVGNAIVWQCRRTADFCDELKREGFEATIRAKTGLIADAYFSGTKMRWLLRHNPTAAELARKGRLAFGTVDSWLIWQLTGGRVHVTDASNASRTLVYNIHQHDWDLEILSRFGIPPETLPLVRPSSGIVGHTDATEWGAEVPIAGIAGDQQAALFGQTCFEKGMAKNTYGTGCFLLMNAGSKAVLSDHGLLTTIAWQIGTEVTYAVEGSAFIAGALIQWLRDRLGLFSNAADTETMALSVADTGGLYIVPAFVGLGAPHWDPYARGIIVGLTQDSGKNHIVRAALEAIAYQSWDLIKAMEKDTGIALTLLRVDGGATANQFLCQFQADILGLAVSRPCIVETTAMGAAFLAGLATGVWKNKDEIRRLWREDQRFYPQLAPAESAKRVEGWHQAVELSKSWGCRGLQADQK